MNRFVLYSSYGETASSFKNAEQFLNVNPDHKFAATFPELVYYQFQLTFDIITLALICGILANRMKFAPMMLFITLWHLAVYCPIAYACWHPEGFLYIRGLLDYAGGYVVHIPLGVSGLVSAVILGPRESFGKFMHSFAGVCFLWVAWFGFNATTAGTHAGTAMLATQIATAVASLSWMLSEWLLTGVPKLTAIGSGAIAGLVAITPTSGNVDPNGAFFIGLFAGPVCLAGVKLKHYLGYDDEFDVFAVHAVGGILGGFMTGFFATGPSYSGLFYTNVVDGGNQLLVQVYSMLFCIGWAGVVTFLILKTIDLTIGLRVNEDNERA